MTCILGVLDRENDKVYIAGDAATSCGGEVRITSLPKVFQRGEFVIGLSGSPRTAQILKHGLALREQQSTEDDEEYMVNVFADGVRNLCKEMGNAQIENSSEGIESALIVAYHKKLYVVYADFQIDIPSDDYDAVGSGREYALGAFRALDGLDLKERIARSLDASAYFAAGVKPPFTIVEA